MSLTRVLVFATTLMGCQSFELFAQNWVCQNPQASSADFLDVAFYTNQIGMAVGARGAIARTTDGGVNWEVVANREFADIVAVCLIGPNSAWGIAEYWFGVDHSTDGGLSWSRQFFSAVSNVDPQAGQFTDVNHGWAVGGAGMFWKTSDGGVSWTEQYSGFSAFLQGVWMVDNSTGYACGNNGTILKTINSGGMWSSLPSGVAVTLFDVRFVNSTTGWAVGSGGTIRKTTNGGTSWVAQTSGTTQQLNRIFFVNANTGWIVANGGVILKTTNGGTNWIVQSSPTTRDLNGAWFTDASNGWIVGDFGRILHTSNGGTNWAEQAPIGVQTGLEGLDFPDILNGWCVGGSGTVIHTQNGGDSWTTQTSGVATSLYGVDFVDASVGWLVGASGVVRKTTNGGAVWNSVNIGVGTPLYDVQFVDTSFGWIAGSTNTIRRTIDGGATWLPCTGCGSGYRDVHFIDASEGWLVGSVGTICHTTDGGVNWVQQTSGTGEDLNALTFRDSQIGWAVGNNNTVLKTINGGVSWFAQNTGYSSYQLDAVEFVNADTGWIAGSLIPIYATTDGGDTWHQHGSLTSPGMLYLKDIHIVDESHAWAVSNSGGTVIKYIGPSSVTLTSPNGGEVWEIGTMQSITWNSVRADYVGLLFYRDFPNPPVLDLTPYGAWNGVFSWIVTGPATANARVVVRSGILGIGDTSATSFTIVNPNLPPVVSHDPLGDQDTDSFTVTCWIADDSTGVSAWMVYHLIVGGANDSVPLAAEDSGEWAGVVPSLEEGRYTYFISAIDGRGISSTTSEFSFDVGADAGAEIAYDDGTAEEFSYFSDPVSIYVQWAVKFGPVSQPFSLYGARIGIAGTIPDTIHLPLYVAVYEADGPNGNPGTLAYEDFSGSVGNIIGGAAPGTHWVDFIIRDSAGNGLNLSTQEYFIAVGNLDPLSVDGVGHDLNGPLNHRSFVADPFIGDWFSEDDTAATVFAAPGNRMIRALVGTDGSPELVVQLEGNVVRLFWTDIGAPYYRIRSGESPDSIADTLAVVTTTSYTDSSALLVDKRFYSVSSSTEP